MILVRPVLLLLGSAWAPAAWALAISGASDEFGGQLFTWYFDEYVLHPLLFTWAAGLVVTLSLWCIGRRFGGTAAFILGLFSILIPMGIIYLFAALSSSLCLFGMSCTPSRISISALFWLACVVAGFSVPAWSALAIAAVVRKIKGLGEPPDPSPMPQL